MEATVSVGRVALMLQCRDWCGGTDGNRRRRKEHCGDGKAETVLAMEASIDTTLSMVLMGKVKVTCKSFIHLSLSQTAQEGRVISRAGQDVLPPKC